MTGAKSGTGVVVATDTGGTFVDTVIVDSDGSLYLGKASSPEGALIKSIESATNRAGRTASDVLSEAELFVNGTTVATNAMIERSGVVTGILLTKGFEDTLSIGRVKARTAGLDEAQVTNYQHASRPPPIVRSEHVRGISERVDYRGEVLLPLDPEDVKRRVGELIDAGVDALAVCYLWSFRNPIHEQQTLDIIRAEFGDLYVTLSSALVPVIREYERANTAVVNSYLGPVVSKYVTDLENTVASHGYTGELLIMQSIGGLTPTSSLRTNPVTALQSGPVGGIIASRHLGTLMGEPNLLTADMGGTSFDVGMILEGEPQTQPATVVERNLLLVPTVDVVSIGAGGGSVAWLDEVGALHVGPQSTGADPGPACYGLGGTQPTVTDADVVLGYISPDYFAGGAMTLDTDKAASVIEEHVARPLGMSVEDAADGIHRIVNAHMADLIRKVSVERGHDPRDFLLVNFGGCGPTHCTGYGPEIGVKALVIPATASVFSAVGIAQSDVRHFFSRSVAPMTLISPDGNLSEGGLEEVRTLFSTLAHEARTALADEGLDFDDAHSARYLEMRYRGQTNELTVPLAGDDLFDQNVLGQLIRDFIRRYEMLYGAGSSSAVSSIELITARLDVTVTPLLRDMPRPSSDGRRSLDKIRTTRSVHWRERGGFVETNVWQGDALMPGDRVEGPAVVDAFGTTFPVRPGQTAIVDEFLNFVIEL